MSDDAVTRAIEIVQATEWTGDTRAILTRVIGAGRVLAEEARILRKRLDEVQEGRRLADEVVASQHIEIKRLQQLIGRWAAPRSTHRTCMCTQCCELAREAGYDV